MVRRIDVVKEYLKSEHNLDKTEKDIISTLCPTSVQYNIHRLWIKFEYTECRNYKFDCKSCWNKEVEYSRTPEYEVIGGYDEATSN